MAFPLTLAEIKAAAIHEIMGAVQKFWRQRGLRQQGLTNGEYQAEALHWAARDLDNAPFSAAFPIPA